jgi:magnesium chelatase subunit D
MAATLERDFYPFTAIVGQEKMKLALVANAINPAIAGVLIRGERGTGKSTAVRALARLLPEHKVVEGCHFGDDPDEPGHFCIECRQRAALAELPVSTRPMRVVELPINASEDRVVGSIDLESALRHGHRRFEPGVLAEANRNILYVDEVNLLDDHIVDVLLDAAAMGVNIVEREGVSIVHPSRFILVGTMNPEEGELRPQLLDRFGLCVDVEGINDAELRVTIVEREAAFRDHDAAFLAEFRQSDARLSERIVDAREAIGQVTVSPSQARLISRICVDSGVQGHRADLVVARACIALAAFRGHPLPTRDDIFDAAELALAHRSRSPVKREEGHGDEERPRDEQASQEEGKSETSDEQQQPSSTDQQGAAQETEDESRSAEDSSGSVEGSSAGGGVGSESTPETADTFDVKKIELPRHRRPRKQGGKRATAQSANRRGRYTAAKSAEKVTDLAVDATIRAAAPFQVRRGRVTGERMMLERSDLREKVRERKTGNLIVFVVDASASMDAEQRMAATKGAILSLLQDAYVRRDRVAVVIFKNRTAEVVLRPTSSVSLARRRLERLSVGGTTPLTHGLLAGLNVIKTEVLRDATVRPLMVLISDGRGNISMFKEEPLVEAQKVAAMIQAEKIDCLVIDSARDFSHLPSIQHLARVAPMYQTYAINACADLAGRMGARYYGLFDLSRDEIASVVERQLNRS